MHEQFGHFPLVEGKAILQSPERSRNSFLSLPDLEAECASDENLRMLFESMEQYCLRYTETVCRFEELAAKASEEGLPFSGEERDEIEKLRTGVHDATIDSINALARQLKERGKDSSWVGKLLNRTVYMKFAIQTAFEIVRGRPEPEEAHV